MNKKFIITEEEKSRILGMHIAASANQYLMEQNNGFTPTGSKYTFKDEASYNNYNNLTFTKPQNNWVNLYGSTISGYNSGTKTFDAAPAFIANIILTLAMVVGNKKSITNYGNWDYFKQTLTNGNYINLVNQLSPTKTSAKYSPSTIIKTIEDSKSPFTMAKDETGKSLGVSMWQKFVTDQVQPVWLSRYSSTVIPSTEPIKKP